MTGLLGWILFGGCAVIVVLQYWYVKQLMKRLLELAAGLNRLKVVATEYTSHLEYLYSLETFHGEPVMQDLILRTKKLTQEIQNNYDLFNIIEGNENDGGETEEREEAETEEKAE